MEAPDFWDNAEASQMKMKQLKSLKDDIETYHNLETQMEDMETMIEMGYEENDPEIVPEIQEMLDEFQASFQTAQKEAQMAFGDGTMYIEHFVEHGSAKWGDAASICKRYRDKRYTQNLILTQNFRMGLDCYKHKRNLNVLVVGGSGAGKSRAYAVVNIMQCNCSMVVTDPKGELLRKTGGLLEREGYEVRVFDLINPETSFCYNPFAYVRDDKDVLKLINNLIRNTTPKGAQSSDPFWEKSETALLQALMLYLLHEAPPEEQNFSMIMEMLGSAQVKEDDEEYQSPLDILFERLEMRNPESIAVKQYAIYKQAAGDICSK